MIEIPTALILGAGASVPYGFPSNLELMNKILNELKPDALHKLSRQIIDLGISPDVIEEFINSLLMAGKLSVDAFLEHRREFLEIGRLAITLTLVKYEIESKLFAENIRGSSWYEYLWNKLDAPFEDFDKNRLSIITFNYDRSIEHYLITAMTKLYKKSIKACSEKLNKIPIIHVHGKLGSLPWQEGEVIRRYSTRHNGDIVKLSKQIKVIAEKADSSREFNKAYKIMNSATKTYFLGFGYHPANLRRLRMKEFKKKLPPETFQGTSQGIGVAERNEIAKNWGIRLYHSDNSCIKFLRNHIVLQ
jgi:hypothetical protein